MMRTLFALFVMALALTPLAARAELKIAVTQGRVEPMPIAVTSFVGDGPNASIGQQITDIVSHDLESSALFRPLNPTSFIQDARSAALDGPRFADWKPLNTQALVTGAITAAPDGRLRVEFRLWDGYRENQVGEFDCHQREEQRRHEQHHFPCLRVGLADEEFLAVQAFRDVEVLLQELYDRVVLDRLAVVALVFHEQELDAGEEQETCEDIKHPVEIMHQSRAKADHEAAHDDDP